VDEGEGLADVMMGPVHPYDRSDGYTPASRWATRHEIANSAEDIIDTESGRVPSNGGSAPAPLVPPKAASRPVPPRTQQPSPPRKTTSRSERAQKVAADLHITTEELRVLRTRVGNAQAEARGLARSDALTYVSKHAGLSVEDLLEYRAAESRYPGPRKAMAPPKPPAQTNRTDARTQALKKSNQPGGRTPPPPQPNQRKTPLPPTTAAEFKQRWKSVSPLLRGTSVEARIVQAAGHMGITREQCLRLYREAMVGATKSKQSPRVTPKRSAKVTGGATPGGASKRRGGGGTGPVRTSGQSSRRAKPNAARADTSGICKACGYRPSVNGACGCS